MSQHSLLIVDHDQDFLDVCAERFKGRGFIVTPVFRANRALDAIAHDRFDAAVLDLMLPDTDGLGFLRELRQLLGKIPIFVLTACTDARHRQDVLGQGADRYLVKPMQLADLEELLLADIEDQVRSAPPAQRAAQAT